jgi:antitoxin HicB
VHPGKRRYTAVVAPGEEQYVVEVPALPGCFTQGKTFGEAVDRVREAIRVHIAGLEADGEPVPEETEHPATVLVEV